MAWRAARSLLILHSQLRPLAPNAAASSWGLIGDQYHTRTSDHAPKDFPGWGQAIVTAADFPDAEQLVAFEVLDAIRRSRDQRVKYGISEGRMFSSYPAHGYPPFTWRPGSGHFDHGHLSVVGDARADIERPWAIARGIPEDEMKPILCNLDGRETVYVKWPGEPLRPLTNPGAYELLVAAGATKLTARTPGAIIDAFGPLPGKTLVQSIDFVGNAG